MNEATYEKILSRVAETEFPVKCGVAKPTKVAIVGFAQTSNHLAPYDDPEYEIWGINEEYVLETLQTSDGRPRWDRWFQLHKRWDFTRNNNANDPKHFEWLKLQRAVEEGGFPIYMQEHWDDIPASVPFPLDDVCRYSRGGRDGNDGYFTNTISYLLAFAAWSNTPEGKAYFGRDEGFKRVEIYGVEMASGTEWEYQRPNLEYHIGMARAHGVEVILPEVCRIAQGRLYAWEVSRMINRQELEFRLGALKKAEADEGARLNVAVGEKGMLIKKVRSSKSGKANKKQNAQMAELNHKEHVHFATANALGGARQEVERLINIIDNRLRPGETMETLPFSNIAKIPINNDLKVKEVMVGGPDDSQAKKE